MAELEKVIKALKRCESYGFCEDKQCPYYDNVSCLEMVRKDALELLKAQELPDVKPEKLEERTTKWLDQMTAEERLEEIAAILDDWDGYRTAKGLGGLINEVWAYALYPVKAQEPRVMTLEEAKNAFVIEYWSGKLKEAGMTILDLDVDPANANYGVIYRVWTSRPTDEQREAVKWDEPPKEGNMKGVGSYNPFCKHCLGVKQNEIGETVVFCEELDLWRNATLGDCFGNCEIQETIDGTEPLEWKEPPKEG